MSVGFKRGVRRLRWTAKQFYKLSDRGFFRGKRVELIDGEILEMAPQTNLHGLGIKLGEDALNVAFGPGHWVRVQLSLDFGPFTVTDPDLAVVPGNPRDHKGQNNPSSALLIAEVSLTTLGYDRHRKASVYARYGIDDYWIINLRSNQLEVRRQPELNAHPRYGYGYASLTTLGPADFVSPLAAPQTRIAVADLLP